ncbi:MAG TPA: pitrilysin family protein, partial [Planctomycetota bacterium]|nr:pitrilysin family protein [Planctomycetota bacterium]
AKVQAWAAQVLDPQRRAVIRVLPGEPERAMSARDLRPAATASAPFVPPAPEQFQLHNGMPVLLWHRPQLPLVALRVQFQPDDVLVTDPARAGLPALTAAMLREGAGDLDALAFAQAMQSLGAAFAIGVDQEAATASLTVLKRNFARAAALVADALRRPRLQPADWERVKRLHLEQLRQQDDEPELVADRIAQRVLYGADNPYGWPVDGEQATVEPLSLADVRAEYQTLFRPRIAVLFVAGDLTVAEARTVLDQTLGDWPLGPELARVPPDLGASRSEALRVVIVDRPEAVQTVIRFIAPGPRYGEPQRLRLQLLNTLLGGSFTSRLNQNLREHHGYAYGAGSSFSMAPYSGHFEAAASVKADVTGAALQEFLAEFARLTHGDGGDVTPAEADKARATVRTEFVQTFGSLHGVLAAAGERTLNGLPFATLAADLAQVDTITAAELNALCKQALPIEQGVLVLVGDRQTILTQLKDLGLPPPTELDAHARPVQR